jgi:nitrite reductase/ring-hydroxylating ferredoxin subunit
VSDLRWVDVGELADLRFGPGAPVSVDGHWLAIFRVDGVLRAIDNACPHASAPLCDGVVTGGKVACFLHCWQFDLATGAWSRAACWWRGRASRRRRRRRGPRALTAARRRGPIAPPP